MSRPRETALRELRRSLRLLATIESFAAARTISSTQTDMLYESIYLSSYVTFEVFIEKQFIALMVGRPYHKGKAASQRVRVKSEVIAYKLVTGQNPFPRFLPTDDLKRLGDLFFEGGRPFSTLDATDEAVLIRGQRLRNAIAHRSKAANNTLKKKVLASVALRPAQRTAAGFLRSIHSPGESRLQNEIKELMRMIAKLS